MKVLFPVVIISAIKSFHTSCFDNSGNWEIVEDEK